MTTTMASGISEKVHPLLLPEILFLLCPLLSTGDLSQACGAYKSWYSAFSPKLWHTVRVGAEHEGNGHVHNSYHLDGLEKNIQFVRSLDIAIKGSSTTRRFKDPEAERAEERLKAILVQCRGLTQISTNSADEELLEVLANNRGTIVSFQMSSAANHQYMLRFWHAFSSDTDAHCLGSLRHLSLKRVEIPGNGGDPAPHSVFVKLCQGLETLDFYNCPMKHWTAPVLPTHNEGENENSEEDTQEKPWAIKQATLRSVLDMISVNAIFLKRCTFLEELIWSSRLDQDMHEDFLQFLIQSRLKLLSAYGASPADNPYVTPQHSKSKFRLDDTLSVDAMDLLTAPWVMSGLVKLELTINNVASLRMAPSTHTGSGSSQNDGFDRIVYVQLSRLVSLEDLVLIETSSTKTSWITFSLSHGMGRLSTLVHLRSLDIGGLQGLKMDTAEGQWICDHWGALECLVVRPNRDPMSYNRLRSYLRTNRPGLIC
ncbi:hypothetical protein B0O80DRAFT_488380 [Mortierella sp. GBAus27b]|nr:hypothetical protein B0O80DRAFT_510851 [Mortierella sp. GBAus27b]KAI8352028.1 hypothetical protein B0O80DRAFT_488380 [Mortierella sp. GBAus27b]